MAAVSPGMRHLGKMATTRHRAIGQNGGLEWRGGGLYDGQEIGSNADLTMTSNAASSMTMNMNQLPACVQSLPNRPARMADDDRKRKSGTGDPNTAVITKTKPQTKRPNLYRVLILNDDYTPMEFVVHVLERFFGKDHEAATRIMLHVHHHGMGECGIYTYEVAETKVTQVMDFARKHQHPLQCVMEKK